MKKGAYVMQQGQRQNLEGEMLNDESTTFEELTLLQNRLNLIIESINGKDACQKKW
jgi:hypothetical protein